MPWKKRFSLTPAETALVDKLLAGKSLQDAARERKITYETARSTLKSVFFKTGTHRQSELIIRLLTKVTAAIFLIACGLWAPNVLAQEEYLTLQSWTACPTIQNTIEMLVFDGLTAHCERIKAGILMVVERKEEAPARRYICVDHPALGGRHTLCNWQTFPDERKTWVCGRTSNESEPCKWGPEEYFTSGEVVTAEPRK